jgi:8-oxo-dGTP diphosphatase
MTIARFKLISAVHVLLLRQDSVLLLRRQHTGYQDGSYSLIAGHLDGNETVMAAAQREAQEEAGLALRPEHLQVVGVMHRRAEDERIDWFVACRHWQGEPRIMEPDKCDRLDWFPLRDLPGNTISYIRRAIENYLGQRWFDSYGWD